MRKILSLFIITTLFAGNLEVEGGITATGEVQSPTIEALLLQIAQLQEQIALLQAQLNSSQGTENQLETRLFEISLSDMVLQASSNHYFNLSAITGVYDKPIHIVLTPSYFGGCTSESYFSYISCEGNNMATYINPEGLNSATNMYSSNSLICSENDESNSDWATNIEGIYLNISGWQFEECGLESIYLIATSQFPN